MARIAVEGWLDCRTVEGRLFFHSGDDSSFRARPYIDADDLDEA
ncbi:hypothetical protein [Amycolatopsis sp. NPDC102389]